MSSVNIAISSPSQAAPARANNSQPKPESNVAKVVATIFSILGVIASFIFLETLPAFFISSAILLLAATYCCDLSTSSNTPSTPSSSNYYFLPSRLYPTSFWSSWSPSDFRWSATPRSAAPATFSRTPTYGAQSAAPVMGPRHQVGGADRSIPARSAGGGAAPASFAPASLMPFAGQRKHQVGGGR